MPKFSVIVPIYNVEEYLEECVESVLAQTYTDFELILVDDGSPDRCGVICDEYALKDSRIRVIHKQNGGLSDARNAGLDQATGEYIYFLDSDDSILPDLLDKAVSEMDKGMDMVVFRFQNVAPDQSTEPGHEVGDCTYHFETEKERCAFFQKVLLPCRIGWEAWARVFRRDLIESYRIRFADNRRIFAEDLYFSLCYCAHVSNICCMDSVFYNYRLRENSIMGVQKKRNNIGRINELTKEVLDHYRQHDDCCMLVDQFSIVYMQIVIQQFINQLWTSGIDPVEFQRITRETVEDWEYLEHHIKSAMRRRDLFRQVGSVERVLSLRCHADYLLGSSWTKLRIQCKLMRLLQPAIDFVDRRIT